MTNAQSFLYSPLLVLTTLPDASVNIVNYATTTSIAIHIIRLKSPALRIQSLSTKIHQKIGE